MLVAALFRHDRVPEDVLHLAVDGVSVEVAELNAKLQQVAQAKDTTGGQLLRSEAELSAARQHADE